MIKKNVYTCLPQYNYIKVGFEGSFSILKWGSSGYTFNRHIILVEKS